ncbi:coiled-coil domain-containing protein 96-like isoform X2 [Symsagittifera roscoffensis]|uniref:coiled-coil domain-containing protein 96-like isoform X2 n=1 Tax=Symsagittifera roscoffensis TaxID=84072 RepID=UPI00307B8971
MLFNLKIKQMADESENRPDTITEEEEGGDNEAAAAVSEPVIDATEEETKTGDEQEAVKEAEPPVEAAETPGEGKEEPKEESAEGEKESEGGEAEKGDDGESAEVVEGEGETTGATTESKGFVETMASEDMSKPNEEDEGQTEGEEEPPADEADNASVEVKEAAAEEAEKVSHPEGTASPKQTGMDAISEDQDASNANVLQQETSEILSEVPEGPPERIDTRSPTDMGAKDEDVAGSALRDVGEEDGEMDEEFSLTEKVPDRESLIEFYQQAMKDREGLVQENTTLQNKLSEYFRRKRTEEGGPAGGGATARGGDQVDRSVSDLEQRYLSFMTNLEELQSKQRESKENYETEIATIKHTCEQKEGELDRMAAEFVEKRRQIAQKAINSRTGKPLQKEEIEMYISNEQKKDQEVKAVRLENIKLKNRLQKREKQLKQKEELAEGLHLIDFEQLKIENQTYNEKIEERNEELSKLRKKITNTVEVLTHLKEKLQYIQQENGQLSQQLKELDVQVAQKRDSLTRIKQNRDKLRNENQELNRQCGLLGNETLLRDYEEKYSESSDLKQRLAELRSRHSELSMKCTGYKKKVENARAGIMIN